MAAIEDLIKGISDPRLRERLHREWSKITEEKSYGLKYEEHLPELLPLYGSRPRVGDLVSRAEGPLKDIWRVTSLRKGVASCVQSRYSLSETGKDEEVELPANTLIVVREFGEPIFPVLAPAGRVACGGSEAPWNILIESDNYHALQLLGYLYPGQVDCIYIDPPYNNSTSEWKYNNNYIDTNDRWRHSKWISMMNRRIRLAKKLLRPSDSVMLIAIDDNELHSLSLLLDDIFPANERQLISITVSPRGRSREGRLSQVDEYIIVIYLGDARVYNKVGQGADSEVRWRYLRRNDIESARGTSKGGPRQFYPIYVDKKSQRIVKIGEPLAHGQNRSEAPSIGGTVAVFPINEEGREMNWGLTGPSLRRALEAGFVRVTSGTSPNQPYVFAYLTEPKIKQIETGQLKVTGVREDGSKIVKIVGGKEARATTAWSQPQHDAGTHGTTPLRNAIGDNNFPFPKSIYAVTDLLGLFVGKNPDALILDFFAGSGTTMAAVDLLNRVDEGRRRCILVTNNEISAEEATRLRAQNNHPGDEAWESNGICRSITWPRCKAMIEGKRAEGTPVPGFYTTGKTAATTRQRKFVQIGFADRTLLAKTQQKKQLTSLIEDLPQSLVSESCDFLMSDDHKSSILFNDSAWETWIEQLDGKDHITDFYIVSSEKKSFDAIKSAVAEAMGPVTVFEPEKVEMSAGMMANLEYFRLDFLCRDKISTRRAFREILPLLWLKAGAVGERPDAKAKDVEMDIFAPEKCNFMVLLDETKISKIKKLIKMRDDIFIYIVTDADESFRAMAAELVSLGAKMGTRLQCNQLYRDYLSNFIINIAIRS